ncbi:MAG: lytic transglycosylase domain-containing protein, partial [Solirubrobacteraceae bacterium]
RVAMSLAALLACLFVGGLLAIALLALPVIGGGSFDGGAPAAQAGSYPVSELARREIPPQYLRLYIAAASRYGLDWAILAGIGTVECDNGRDPAPSCTQEGVENYVGAGGPMQFLASTWATYGVSAYGNGTPDRWNPADAIFSAANYLRASGAPGDYYGAIFAYNHASWYVEEVEAWARRYTAQPGEAPQTTLVSSTPVLYVRGEQAKLLRSDGHVALLPEEAPAAVQAMIIAGNELQQMPYGPSGHPNPLGATSEDCSSTVSYILYKAGIRPLSEIVADNPLAQDYVHWGQPGPGRWVTIYATDLPEPHVFIVIAGLRLDTSYNGTDEGPNRYEGGPRWRLLPYIPTWAHWSVRHPPGL